jgi:hypothetical protein
LWVSSSQLDFSMLSFRWSRSNMHAYSKWLNLVQDNYCPPLTCLKE